MNPIILQDYRFSDVIDLIDQLNRYSPKHDRSSSNGKPVPKKKRVSVKVTDA